MYVTDQTTHDDPAKRWTLPDRIFFACGACHILAYACIEQYKDVGFSAIWMKPRSDYRGNHVIAVAGDLAFDYHGFSRWPDLKSHFERKANRWWPGWTAHYIPLPQQVLISERLSKTYDGLWLREPRQFLHDAMPRAVDFLNRFDVPSDQIEKAPHSCGSQSKPQ